MLFVHMFSCIPWMKRNSQSKTPRRARKGLSSHSQGSLRRKLSKPFSSLLKLMKRKNKLNKVCSKSLPTGDSVPSHVDLLPSENESQPSLSEIKGHDFQHSIIYVTPVDSQNITDHLAASIKLDVSQSVTKRPAKISRASALRRECTSLPSLLPHQHPLPPSLLRRSPSSVSNQRCCSIQTHEVPFSMKTDVLPCKSPALELPASKANKAISSTSSVVSFTALSQSSSQDEVDYQSFNVATRPPSRNGIAYEIVFKAPSVHCSLTPEPRFGPDYTYTFPRATTKANEDDDDDDDNWDTDGEFTDSDESDGEEEETDNATPLAPQCKYGVFFTAAKPPLPPSALERIRKYRNYQF